MPMNLLPILAIGGGLAYIVTKKRKDTVCPSRIRVDETKVQPQAAKALSGVLKRYMAGESVDPIKAADEFFSLFAPLTCKKTDSIIEFRGQEVVAKDLYAQLISQFEAGAQMLEIFEGFAGENRCPTSIMIDIDATPKIAEIIDSIDGNKNPDAVANDIFSTFLPLRCKWSEATIVSADAIGVNAPAPDVYGAVLADVLEEYRDNELMSQEDAEGYFDQFKSEFTNKTGREWKDPIGAA